MPLVSLSVGLIMFEGGLTLKFRELDAIGSVVIRLISVGALMTWGLSLLLARFALGLATDLSRGACSAMSVCPAR